MGKLGAGNEPASKMIPTAPAVAPECPHDQTLPGPTTPQADPIALAVGEDQAGALETIPGLS